MSQAIVMPELDGGIESYAISAQFSNEQGLHVFQGIPERIETFADRVKRWLTLQRKPNADKRVAIVYFRGPGRSAMTAGGLEVAPSLFNMLLHFQEQGFDTGELPEDADAFWEMIQEKGPVLGPYAAGAFQDFVDSGHPELIPVEDYLDWVRANLERDLYLAVEEKYGPAPGQYLATQREGQAYIAIPRIELGNVVLMPQLLPAAGDDEIGVIHGADVAPTHPYIAQYLWAREGFGADVLMHFGTHGSLEFTPGKQAALSQYDWPDALVGDLPHLYVYVINNVGEAMIAKRRSYAVINSHLTPPFMESELYGDLATLHDRLHDYMLAEDGALRRAYLERIVELMRELKLDKDLRLEGLTEDDWNADLFNRIHNYVHQVEHEQITDGLYTMGQAYTDEQLADTVRQISINPLAYALARLEVLEGVEDEAILDDLHRFELQYREPAMEKIDALLAGEAEPRDFVRPEHAAWMAKGETGGRGGGHGGAPDGWSGATAQGEDGGAHPHAIMAEILKRGVEDGPAADLVLAIDGARLEPALQDWDVARTRTFLESLAYFAGNRDIAPILEEHGGKGFDAVAAILGSDQAMVQINGAAALAEEELGRKAEREREYGRLVETLVNTLHGVRHYYDAVRESPDREFATIVHALNGAYVPPSSGGDPITNPDSVPTGRNLYSIDPERTPTEEAWKVGVDLADQLIVSQLSANGEFPQKVAMTFWGSEYITTQGIGVAQALYLMGVRPMWDSRGIAHDVQLIPSDELGRPRIDVVIQTSGQFRDIGESRIYLLQKAAELANSAPPDPKFGNYVREGTEAAERVLREKGMSPLDARTFATARVFGGANGNYGTNIMGLVESGDQWEDESEIAEQYLRNMGAIYTQEHWGHYAHGLFEAALQYADTVVHPRASNTWGPLSLDHVYEFMGGISATIRHVTGRDPDAYFNDLRNQHRANVQGAEEAIWVEARSTMLNPRYIEGLQNGGASSAAVFAETFRNTYGWNVMKPDAIDNALWEEYNEVYVEDRHDMGLEDYFREVNPYALQEMTAVMLETIRKEYWDADEAVIDNLANLHANLVQDHEAGCTSFVCDNRLLRKFIAARVDAPEIAESYLAAIDNVRTGQVAEAVEGMRLEPDRQTMDAVRVMVQDNAVLLSTLVVLVLLFSGAVYYGAMRRTA